MIDKHLKVFHIETAMNNRMFDPLSAFLGENEDRWSGLDRTKFRAAQFALSKMSAPMKRKLFFSIPAPYEMIGVHAGETEATHKKILKYCFDQYAIPVQGQSDVLIVGITFVSPYNVNSIMNPVLVQVMATGYFFNFYRHMPLVKKNGVLIVTHPCYDEFDPVFHPSYIEFFNRILTETRDSFVMQEKYEEEFARNPEYIRMYREGNAYHGVHPFYMWYWGENGRAHLGKVIVVGADNKRVPSILGWDTASSHERSVGNGRIPCRILTQHQPDALSADPDGRCPRDARNRWARKDGRRWSGQSMTSWRFDPVKGEYVSTDQTPPAGTGEISAMDQFNSKTILILGATGFVGKVLLAMILDRFPELKHLVIQVRRKKNVSGKQRFLSDVLDSPPLRTVVGRLGLESILKRTSIIEGRSECSDVRHAGRATG